MDELEDRVEDELQDHVGFQDDAEFESEIEAIVGALEPIGESDAVEVLTTWKQTRMAMNQEKAQSGHDKSTTRNFLKPDLAKLAGRTRCSRSF